MNVRQQGHAGCKTLLTKSGPVLSCVCLLTRSTCVLAVKQMLLARKASRCRRAY